VFVLGFPVSGEHLGLLLGVLAPAQDSTLAGGHIMVVRAVEDVPAGWCVCVVAAKE
jgi:hypothetical protein